MIEEGFPGWLRELRRFQALKSQIYLYGNVYDLHYFPTNYRDATSIEDLEFAKVGLPELLREYLLAEGHEVVAYYDVVDGFDVVSRDGRIGRDQLLDFVLGGEEAARRAAARDPLARRLARAQFTDLGAVERSLRDTVALARALVTNRRTPASCIINFASRLTRDPTRLQEDESRLFLELVKAAQGAREAPDARTPRNLLLFLCDRLNDLPPWLLLENPLTHGIEVRKPDHVERRRFFAVQGHRFEGAERAPGLGELFADLTSGFTNREMENLITLSQQKEIPLAQLREVVDLYKYGERKSLWEKLDAAKVRDAEQKLGERVLGQEEAVRKAIQVLRRAQLGLHAIDQLQAGRPKGVLFFAGPTGTGKTELARSLAELLFNDREAVIRFDMSEYDAPHSAQRLIGAPPGYIGYEDGGQLTRRVRERPFSVVLFDEIEKAHPSVFDKFLQILDDGRLTDGKGETVYFAETLIIFTSNLGMYTLDAQGKRVPNVTLADAYPAMAGAILREVQDFFTTRLNRPEILNRFGDNIVVFDFIRPERGIDARILRRDLTLIAANLAKEKGCTLRVGDAFVEGFLHDYVAPQLAMGGRGIKNQVEAHVKNGIVDFLFELGRTRGVTFEATLGEERDAWGRRRIRFRSC